MKTLIIYHREDNDGVFSAAIAMVAENEYASENDIIDTLGLTYEEVKQIASDSSSAKITQKSLLEDYDRVVMVDINLGETLMRQLYEKHLDEFVWCDHHGPIIEALKEVNIKGHRDTGHSAIYHTWIHYAGEGHFQHIVFPVLLDYLQLWDSWTYTNTQKDLISDVNVGITAIYELDLQKAVEVVVDLICGEPSDTYLEHAKSIGGIIRTENNRKNAEIMSRSCDVTFTVGPENRPAGCILYSTGTGSYTFEHLKEIHPEIMHGAVLRRSATGTWSMSLYNIYNGDDFHCGQYLKETYGGGGHLGAGGAEITEEQALNILKTKHI